MADEDDGVVLTYGDTTLYESDVALLEPNQWLNDSLIAFWFEYLAQVKFKDHAEELLFIDPSAMFMINFSQDVDEIREVMAPLEMQKRRLILMPINNNAHIDRAGGTHWSLLVYSRNDGKFRYYDSLSSRLSVSRAAKRTAKMVHAVMGGKGDPIIEAAATPQQTNTSDCGALVCAVSSDVAAEALDILPAGGLLQRLGVNAGAEARKQIKQAINKVKQQ